MSELPEYVLRNRAFWDEQAARHVAPAERHWVQNEPTWGIWAVPEADVGMLPDDLDGKDAIELGCGTAYFSAWLARRGARPVGVDVTPAQLETARRLQRKTGIEFRLIEANAEEVPLADASFDLALSEYGASIWCDPYRWIPEAHRLLRPGGRLVFLRGTPLLILCALDEATSETLQRPERGMNRIAWPDGGVEFHLPHGELLGLLRETGFEVESLIELYAPEGATTHEYYSYVTAEWASKWPVEEIWAARKRA